MPNQDEEKNARIEIVKPRIFNLSSKTFSRYEIPILLCSLKFTPKPKRNNIELKSNIQNSTRRLQLADLFQKQTILRKIVFKNNLLLATSKQGTDLDHQLDVLNNGHKIKSKME